MSVTPTPYGATNYNSGIQPVYVCLLSQPDTDTGVLHGIQTGRQVLRGSSYNTLTLPGGNSQTVTPSSNSRTISLPAPTPESQGVFYCEVSSRGLTTRVPVTILLTSSKYFNSLINPSNSRVIVIQATPKMIL